MRVQDELGNVLCDNINQNNTLEITEFALHAKKNVRLENVFRHFVTNYVSDYRKKKIVLHPYRSVVLQAWRSESWIVVQPELYDGTVPIVPRSNQDLLGLIQFKHGAWRIWGSTPVQEVDGDNALYWKIDERFAYFMEAFETLYAIRKLA